MARTTKTPSYAPDIPLYERYLLTVEETSAYFHIGSKKMYEMSRKIRKHHGCCSTVTGR